MERTPPAIRTAATAMVVAGGIDLLLMWWMSSTALGCGLGLITSVLTAGLCPFGAMAGFLGWLLIPLGLLEVLAGVLILTDARNARVFLGWMPWVQMLAIFAGGFSSALFGLVIFVICRDPEAQAFMRRQR